MLFWDNFGRFIYKSAILTLDLLDIVKILHNKPNLRFMRSLKAPNKWVLGTFTEICYIIFFIFTLDLLDIMIYYMINII
jgi:hypothetical protein